MHDRCLPTTNAAPAVDWYRVFPTMMPVRDQGGYVTVKDEYPLGADKLGRDLLSRIIYGARISLAVALIGPFISILSMGVLVGHHRRICGWAGGHDPDASGRCDVCFSRPAADHSDDGGFSHHV